MIRRPHPNEIKLLPQIENEADRRYARVGLGRIVDMPPASIAALEFGRRHDRLWVATSPLGRPVGFALMKLKGGTVWLDQLSVLAAPRPRRGADRPHRPASADTGLRHALSLDLSRRAVERAVLCTTWLLCRAARALAAGLARAVHAGKQPRPSALAALHHAAPAGRRRLAPSQRRLFASTSSASAFSVGRWKSGWISVATAGVPSKPVWASLPWAR